VVQSHPRNRKANGENGPARTQEFTCVVSLFWPRFYSRRCHSRLKHRPEGGTIIGITTTIIVIIDSTLL
jgi:hypothetical protein